MQRVGTHKLLEPIINGMNRTILVSAIVTVGLVHTLSSCNTKWLTFNKNNPVLTIEAVDYTVISVTPNVEIVITHPTITPTAESFDIDPPFFFHGTLKATNSELVEIPLSWDKIPMVYLWDPTPETDDDDEFSSIDRVSQCDLYFMTENNIQDWTNEDHENLAVVPARNMYEAFKTYAAERRDLICSGTKYYPVLNRVRWGDKETTGNAKQYFTENVSGLQVGAEISFMKSAECCEG